VPFLLKIVKSVVPVPDMVCKKEYERGKGKEHGYSEQPAVPGQDSKHEERRGERDRKCKAAKCPFQGREKRDLEQDQNCKPADDGKDLLFS